jgi:hypothetical protein
MSQKSVAGKELAEKVIKNIRRVTRRRFWPKRRYASCWMGFEANPVLPSCVVARASPRDFITAGRKSSWKPASDGWRGIRRGRPRVVHRPRLLSDNGSSYLSADLAQWLDDRKMQHVRGAPYHPQTQGKIERWHQTLKNRILLENYYLPGDLEAQIGQFVAYYNHLRY